MSGQKFSLVDDFIDKFKHSLTHKSKTSTSNRNHLEEIANFLESLWRSFNVEISPFRVSLSRNPVVYLKSKNFTSVDLMLTQIETLLKQHQVKFKKHKYSGCYPFFSLYNPTIPSLLSSKSHTLLTLTTQGNSKKPCFKLELLQDYQVVRILNAQINSLEVVIWTGHKMSKLIFETDATQIGLPLETGDLVKNLKSVATTKENSWKIEADFIFYAGQGLILEKIRELSKA